MKRKYQTAEHKIETLTGKLRRNRERRTEAAGRIEATRNAIDSLSAELSGALVQSDASKAKKLESEIEKLRGRSIERDELLLAGLDEEAKALEAGLQEAEAHKHRLFVQLCEQWLTGAAARYDDSARQTIERARELKIVYDVLRDTNEGGAFTKTVGPGFEALPTVAKIPILKGYARASDSLAHGRMTAGAEKVQAILDEVLR